MNSEDIIRMAREAGICRNQHTLMSNYGYEDAIERLVEAAYSAGAAAERNKLAAWMIEFGFATGHGDTMEQLLDALGTEIVDRIDMEVDAIRARGQP